MRKTSVASTLILSLSLSLATALLPVPAHADDLARARMVLLETPSWIEGLLETQDGRYLMSRVLKLAILDARRPEARLFKRQLYQALRSSGCQAILPEVANRLELAYKLLRKAEARNGEVHDADVEFAARAFLRIVPSDGAEIKFLPVEELPMPETPSALSMAREKAIQAWRNEIVKMRDFPAGMSGDVMVVGLPGPNGANTEIGNEVGPFLKTGDPLFSQFSLRMIQPKKGGNDLELMREASPNGFYGEISLKLDEASRTVEVTMAPVNVQERDAILVRFIHAVDNLEELLKGKGGTGFPGVAQVSIWPPMGTPLFNEVTEITYAGLEQLEVNRTYFKSLLELFRWKPKLVIRNLPWSMATIQVLYKFLHLEIDGIRPEVDKAIRESLPLRTYSCEEDLLHPNQP